MQPKQSIVSLPVYQPGKPIEEVKRELGLKEVIKLASNENPFGSSEQAKAAVLKEMENISIYPDSFSTELTAEVAKFLGVERDQIIFGAGSDEVILMLARAFLVPGDETVMADETFSQYRHNAVIEGATIVEVPLKNGVHDLPAMLNKITDLTKIVWVCNPNNPTGTIVGREELKSFISQVPSHVIVVLDEAYIEYITDESALPDSVALIGEYKNVILLRTFSKIHGLASLRIGYGAAHVDLIRMVNQVREPFNTTRIAQAAAIASLADQDFVKSCRERNAEGKAYMYKQFDRLGLPYFEAHGNFVMVDVKMPSGQAFDGLLRRGIISRARWKHYPNHIRITIGSQDQNEAFIAALESVLTEAAVLG
ncbi:histidinol-phosphate transaminase [Paenibacillus sacheonensis]|uniref:Histidinol-phosphate aminotransferase n=1 Tax=Paenibacillus sacheonensis TaxID=742054 RepID=A0A7X5BXW6_9BACL|nr:histidinol-phosphate transaminase [Paenibacillus sacheonensis]MBM7564503.1 histidinol-phosphate aminotransferase [Paenibacillus sacheonensis]NBC69062.1 histidinol-phosphate transaminase [Paenibacillus sacheonensis]